MQYTKITSFVSNFVFVTSTRKFTEYQVLILSVVYLALFMLSSYTSYS